MARDCIIKGDAVLPSRIVLLFFALLLFHNLSHSQNFTFEWISTYGDVLTEDVRAIVNDSEENLYATGSFKGTINFITETGTEQISSGSTGIFILKLDSTGKCIWAKSFDGIQFGEGTDVAVDSYGNVYITGRYSASVDFDPGITDYFLSAVGYTDIFVLKLDADGNLVWAQTIGGAYSDTGQSVLIDNSGNAIITGEFEGNFDFDPGIGTHFKNSLYRSIFVLSLDSNGNFNWVTTAGVTYSEYVANAMVDFNNNVFVAGHYYSSAGGDFSTEDTSIVFHPNPGTNSSDIFYFKLDSNGIVQWIKFVDAPGSNESASSFCRDENGNLFIAGHIEPDGTIPVTSDLYGLQLMGQNDALLIKSTDSGDIIFSKSCGGSSYDAVYDVSLDNDGNIFLTGYFSDTVQFDQSNASTIRIAVGSRDFFLEKFDSLGNFLWVESFGGLYFDTGNSLICAGSDQFYLAGSISDQILLNISNKDSVLSAYNATDFFIGKFEPRTINNIVDSTNIGMYPNPATTSVKLVFASFETSEITIYDMAGRFVYSTILPDQTNSIEIDISNFSSGTYIVIVQNDSGISTEKLVIY